LPEDVRALAPEIAWPRIVGMRNVLVYGYFDHATGTPGLTSWQMVLEQPNRDLLATAGPVIRRRAVERRPGPQACVRGAGLLLRLPETVYMPNVRWVYGHDGHPAAEHLLVHEPALCVGDIRQHPAEAVSFPYVQLQRSR
jgi:hypothetical protein